MNRVGKQLGKPRTVVSSGLLMADQDGRVPRLDGTSNGAPQVEAPCAPPALAATAAAKKRETLSSSCSGIAPAALRGVRAAALSLAGPDGVLVDVITPVEPGSKFVGQFVAAGDEFAR